MISAPDPQTLDLTDYPAHRRVSLTEHECDLVSRIMTIALAECAKSAANGSTSAMENLGAAWLSDEIKRIERKFGAP